MNKLNFTKIMMIIAIMLCPIVFYGQNSGEVKKTNFTNFKDYFYVTGDLGLGALSGDNSEFKFKMNGHVGVGYQFDNILGTKLNFGYGGLNGKFSNNNVMDVFNYIESNINLTINLTDIILGYNPKRKFNVVPHIGFGQIQYRVQISDAEGNIKYKAGFKGSEDGNIMDDGIGRRKVVATLPMGLEVNYNITPKIGAYIDFTTNYTDTDALDAIIASKNDWFATVNLGASYKFNDNHKVFRSKSYCNYWFSTIDGGASFLNGDNNFEFNSVRGNANIGGGYNFANNFRLYAKLGFGIYKGVGNTFTLNYADYYEINFNASADLIGIIFGQNDDRRIGLYPHIGIGQMQYRARTTYDDGSIAQVGYNSSSSVNRKGGGIAGRRVALTVPIGAELTYHINRTYEAYLDVTSTYANSDLLDAVIAGVSYDWHSSVNFGLRYKFNDKCYWVPAPVVEEKCITPEEIKEAIKNAIEEQEAVKAESIKTIIQEVVEDSVVYHQNFTNIVFPINKSEKLDSQTNIDALNRASKEMRTGSEVNKIVVEGYASPDGNKELNDRLAKERAEEAAALVQQELGTDVQIEITSKGADWDGLIKAIEGSNIENKTEIANQIKNSDNREKTLRELMGKYPQIKELLPQLRRAGVTITTVK